MGFLDSQNQCQVVIHQSMYLLTNAYLERKTIQHSMLEKVGQHKYLIFYAFFKSDLAWQKQIFVSYFLELGRKHSWQKFSFSIVFNINLSAKLHFKIKFIVQSNIFVCE